jgi:hypothetical protein
VSKFFLCFILAVLLMQQLGHRIPITILSAVLFCMSGDVLLQPLDLDYTDMSGDRPVHFILGVVCFCAAYVQLARYYLSLNPEWAARIKAQPWALVVNVLVTLTVLVWLTVHNQAPSYLLIVLWLYSPVVIGAATLAVYVRGNVGALPFLALVIGSNAIAFSDTIIGLTVFAKVAMPFLSNPVWILSTYILGIFLVFNAVILIEKRAALAIR